MGHRIDETDRAIVSLLQKDGRMSSAEIARRVEGISERAVRYRIDRLIRDSVIRVSALVNPVTLGLPVLGDISLEVESGKVQEVARRVTEFECVAYVAFSMGDRDVALQINARDSDEVYRFATEVVGRLPGVRKTSTLILPLKLKDVYDWQIPSSFCMDNRDKSQ
jgi:Lrp/AsnC family transcriptional regulator for asnA, asnC and gidA